MAEMDKDHDLLLLEEIREGSAVAFNRLYAKYWRSVYIAAIKMLKDHDQTQDIVQDIFINLWLKREELMIGNLSAYLRAAVRNRVLNLFEREKRYVPFGELLGETMETSGSRADALALRNEFLHAYKALIDSLPAKRKKIFRLYDDEGLSSEEIARRLQLSRKTVQNQLGRAFSFLKANLSHLFLLIVLLFS